MALLRKTSKGKERQNGHLEIFLLTSPISGRSNRQSANDWTKLLHKIIK